MKIIITLWILTFNIPAFGQKFVQYAMLNDNKNKSSLTSKGFKLKANNSNIRLTQTNAYLNALIKLDGVKKEITPNWGYLIPRYTSPTSRIGGQMWLMNNSPKSLLLSNNSLHIFLRQYLKEAKFEYIIELTSNEVDNPFGFSIIYKKKRINLK